MLFRSPAFRPGPVIAFGLLISLGVGIFVSPFASEHPDGLEYVAEQKGFAREGEQVLAAPLPDYQFRWVSSSTASTAIAGGIGTIIVFGLSLLLGRTLVPRAQALPVPAAAT